ncbi:hypothetical protein F4604DRAFT_1905268 [Suillus subluteus]|nr:hypothetical protein F4604DRAFT_1905268 [Suillus subluteus]
MSTGFESAPQESRFLICSGAKRATTLASSRAIPPRVLRHLQPSDMPLDLPRIVLMMVTSGLGDSVALKPVSNLLQDLPRIALNCNEWTWRLRGLKACQSRSRMVMFLTRANCCPLHDPTIPSQTLSVMQLLNLDLCASLDCNLSSDTIIFSTNPPLLSLPNDFMAWSIPPLHCITQLLDQFSQAWFNGHASVIHPLSPTFHLPFWVLSYWREISRTLEARLAWISAHDWVLRRLEDEDVNDHAFESVVIDEVLSMFEHLPWDVELKGFGAHASLHTSKLLPLLADLMVNGRLLDALVAAINDHVDEHNGTVVETLDFANVLLLDSLHNGTIQRVIFPINVANVHWAIISVDASTQMILYGDSLEWSMPSSYVDATCLLVEKSLASHHLAKDPCLTGSKQTPFHVQSQLSIPSSTLSSGTHCLPMTRSIDFTWRSF